MKKLVIVLVIVVIIMIVLNIAILVKFYLDSGNNNDLGFEHTDTAINRLRIDSIQLVITKRDSTIYNIKYAADEDIFESLNDTDSAAIVRFLELAGSD